MSTAALAYGTIAWTGVTGYASQAQTLCMPFTPVSNCATYDQESSTISSNTFACATCSTGYYLFSGNNTCIARAVKPNGCLTFSPSTDTCTSCSTGMFLNTPLNTLCVSFPNGIFNCIEYSDQNVCTRCGNNSYLSENTCIDSTAIDRCSNYSANYTCTSCSTGYFLFNSTSCIESQAQNCYTYASQNACASCDPDNENHGLQTTNGITSCVEKNVPNCVTSTSVSPFTCIVC